MLTQRLMGIVVHTAPRANGSCSSHPLGLMGIAVSAQGTPGIRPREGRDPPPPQKPSPLVLLGPILASASFPDGCVCIFFSFFAFFFFPLFYYCFNNNKRARGSQALARSWRPMGVLGRGRGEVSGGQRWRVKKVKVGDLGLAQEAYVPHSLPPPLPASTWLLTTPPRVLWDRTPLQCVCVFSATSSSWTSSPPTF